MPRTHRINNSPEGGADLWAPFNFVSLRGRIRAMADAKTDFNVNIPEKIQANPDVSGEIGAVFLFRISGENGGVWTVNLKDDLGVKEGEHGEADVTLELSDEDWETISEDPSASMNLFFQNKLVVKGNVALATKLQSILS